MCQSHDSHVTVLVHLTTSAMLGSFVVTNNRSAGQVFDLSGIPREVQASDWQCYISYTPHNGCDWNMAIFIGLPIHLLLIFPSLPTFLPLSHTPTLPCHTPSHTHSTHFMQGLALPTSRHLYPFTLEGSLFIAAAVSTTPRTVEQSIIKEQMNTDTMADFYPRYRQHHQN